MTPKITFLVLLCIAILVEAVAEFESSVNPSFIFLGAGAMRAVVFASIVLLLLYYSAIGWLRRFLGKHKKSDE